MQLYSKPDQRKPNYNEKYNPAFTGMKEKLPRRKSDAGEPLYILLFNIPDSTEIYRNTIQIKLFNFILLFCPRRFPFSKTLITTYLANRPV